MTSSAWGFEWSSALWGSGTPALTETGDLDPMEPGELDHVETARNRIWKMIEGLPNWLAIMELMGELLQSVEGALAQVHASRYVGTAVGVQLDLVAEAVGTERGPFTDDDLFRLAIIVDARTLIASTTAPEILELARRIAPDGAIVRLQQIFPSTIILTITDLDADTYQALLVIFQDVPGAGKAMHLETYDSDLVAGWDSVAGSAGPPLGSWGSVTGPTGSVALWTHTQALGA